MTFLTRQERFKMATAASFNIENWIESFQNCAGFLEELKVPARVRLLDGEPEKQKYLAMGIFGRFECETCPSGKTKKPAWTSTKSSTLFTFWLTPRGRGTIKMEREYQQKCRNCETWAQPRFDLEATDIAMDALVDFILKAYFDYNEDDNNSAICGRHSRARARQTPHDSTRCEGCANGFCNLNGGFRRQLGVRNDPTPGGLPAFNGGRVRYRQVNSSKWSFEIGGKSVKFTGRGPELL